MKSLFESILKSTGSGSWSSVFNFKTKPYNLKDISTKQKLIDDFCTFYENNDREVREDVSKAVETAIYDFGEYGFEAVFDKDVVEKLQYWLDKDKIKFEHDLDYVPTLYNADDIAFVIKTIDGNHSYWWVWHWGNKRNLFSHTNKWVMIKKK